MNTDPVQFFSEDFPRMFNEGVGQLKARADEGDEKAEAGHADVVGARGFVRIVLEGDGGAEVILTVADGEMRLVSEAPEDLPVRMSIAAPAEAARAALVELVNADLIDPERAPRRIARSASAQTEAILSGHKVEFHLTLADLPAEPSEVTLRIGIGVVEPPTNPKFTAKVSWDDVEDVRAGEMTPQQLFGRLKLTGDATQAMALGMTLMQRRRV